MIATAAVHSITKIRVQEPIDLKIGSFVRTFTFETIDGTFELAAYAPTKEQLLTKEERKEG